MNLVTPAIAIGTGGAIATYALVKSLDGEWCLGGDKACLARQLQESRVFTLKMLTLCGVIAGGAYVLGRGTSVGDGVLMGAIGAGALIGASQLQMETQR